jgi:hypothetical protein
MASRGTVPLSVLLSHALLALTRDFEQAVVGRESTPSLPLWSNLLRVLSGEGVDQREVPRLACISQRAARIASTKAKRRGWLVVEPSPGPKGGKLARLTPAGAQASVDAASVLEDVETRWRSSIGPDRIEEARAALGALVTRIDVELPHFPTGYGQGDAGVTGGPWIAGQEGPPRVPAHGEEWPVVLRTDRERLEAVPLSALLSQSLLAFTIDYESKGLGWLATAATVLQYIGDDGVPLSGLGGEERVTGTGRSTLERHGVIVVEPHPSGRGKKLVRLTSLGKKRRDAYEPLVREVEQRWRTLYGPQVVADLRASLESLVSLLDTQRLADHPPMISWLSRRDR